MALGLAEAPLPSPPGPLSHCRGEGEMALGLVEAPLPSPPGPLSLCRGEGEMALGLARAVSLPVQSILTRVLCAAQRQ